MSERIAPPNYTQMPNQVLDAMPSLSCAETKVVLAVCRKTFGWHKETALLSLTYLEKMTGLSRQGVVNGLDSLLKRGWLSRTESGQSFEYEVLIESPVNENDQSTELTSQQSCKEVGNGVDTLKKGKKLSNFKIKEINLKEPIEETGGKGKKGWVFMSEVVLN